MANLSSLTIEDIKDKASEYLSAADVKIVVRAYEKAYAAHQGQKRKSGEPFIQHPLHVCLTLIELRLDPATLAAAFLHDVVEDTPSTITDIRKQFGWRIGQLVDGVTKLDAIEEDRGFFGILFRRPNRQLNHQERRIESLRKMLLATSKDIRVILIKLADRLHNMQTLQSIEEEKRIAIAQETLEIYAPIAYRLGIGTIKGALEDLSFAILEPTTYQSLVRQVKHETVSHHKQIRRIKQILQRMLQKTGLKAEIQTRIKHYYSLYRKLERYDGDISKIYDLVACRIIVENVEQCYEILGLIHNRWQPYEGRVKDYIANPKHNGYQSIHTTVHALSDRPIEIQIRTRAMHEQAEFGIAAHWHYSEQKGALNYLRRQVSRVPKNELSWVNQLVRWQKKTNNYQDFDELMKIDFFGDRVFVYTPKGEVVDLPTGATPIDFAYAIHSEIGNHLSGAKVNGKMSRLQDQLSSGDTVELQVQKKAEPKEDWLAESKTASAKAHIRRALRLRKRNGTS